MLSRTLVTPSRTPLRPVARAAAVLLLASAAGAASAQSSVTLYGLIDASVGQFQVAGGPKLKRLDSGNMSTSYLGFRGSEDLGGGLRASFTLESFFLVDSGGASRVPGVDAFWARNANVGLSGDFGTLRLGRAGTPLFVSSLVFNAFGDSFGYSPTIRQYYNAPYGTPLVGDSGWSNSIYYTSPRMGGLTANVQIAAGEGAATARGPNLGGNLVYFSGNLGLTAAYQKVEAQGVLGRPISAFPGFSSQTAFQLGGSYDFKAVKLFVQYGSIDTKATSKVEVDNLHISASVPLGTGAFLASYGNSDISSGGAETSSKMLSLGYNYSLSKRTQLYGVYLSDKYTARSSGTTYALGLRHTF